MCGDGATVHRMPLLNILFITGEQPPFVLRIEDCMKHMAEGGTKKASYIADLFCDKIIQIDPNRTLLTCVFMEQRTCTSWGMS